MQQDCGTRKTVSQINAAIVLYLPLRGRTGGQFEPTIITVSAAKRKTQMWQDCGTRKLLKNCVTITHLLNSGNAHIRINSGARGEVKPCMFTVNAIKKVDNGGGIMQCENYEGL
jgi:hypothetical protein